jgi:hypothetical protein
VPQKPAPRHTSRPVAGSEVVVVELVMVVVGGRLVDVDELVEVVVDG